MTDHAQIMSRLLCFFGFHKWHYKLSEVGYVPLKGWPFGTTCQHCHKPHPRPLPAPHVDTMTDTTRELIQRLTERRLLEHLALIAETHDCLDQPEPEEPSDEDRIKAAFAMGQTGAPPSETERLAFESWMRGHSWLVEGVWNGTTYDDRGPSRVSSVDVGAMQTRMLWAAWRDRAALARWPLAAIKPVPVQPEGRQDLTWIGVAEGLRCVLRDDSEDAIQRAWQRSRILDAVDLIEANCLPVPVAERLPEAKDCDAEGRCWWWDDDDDKWCLHEHSPRILCWTYWLPHYALPVPVATGKP